MHWNINVNKYTAMDNHDFERNYIRRYVKESFLTKLRITGSKVRKQTLRQGIEHQFT